VRNTAPEYGQHTEEILTGVLGMSWDEITALKDKKVIA
jgi:crotonobetainyl-CoA:carnitine CoA-transferase CaiB-like acyl-CoA transferase